MHQGGSLLPRLFVWLIAAVGVCALMAGSAQASCGDWLDHSVLNDPAPATHQMEPPPPVPTPEVPCDGPLCQQRSETPPPSAPATITVRVVDKICAASGVLLAGMLPSIPAAEGACAVGSDGFPRRIDRPPRV